MRYLLVFGSLRKNSRRGYNYQRFGGQKYIKDIQLNGFDMVSLGGYPAISEGSGTIKTELHEVEDISYGSIYRMEIGAGYYEKVIKLDDDIKASIFLMDKEKVGKYQKVKSGDWN